MKIEDFEIVEEIGKGQFATIYKVLNIIESKFYALKCYNLTLLSKRRFFDNSS